MRSNDSIKRRRWCVYIELLQLPPEANRFQSLMLYFNTAIIKGAFRNLIQRENKINEGDKMRLKIKHVYPRMRNHSLYRSPNIVRVIKSRTLGWAGHVARMEEGTSAFKILTGKPTGKRSLGKPRLRQEDNIRKDIEEIGINAGNWVDSAQDRNYWRALVNAALNLRVP